MSGRARAACLPCRLLAAGEDAQLLLHPGRRQRRPCRDRLHDLLYTCVQARQQGQELLFCRLTKASNSVCGVSIRPGRAVARQATKR